MCMFIIIIIIIIIIIPALLHFEDAVYSLHIFQVSFYS
jgi:hypothetical protein